MTRTSGRGRDIDETDDAALLAARIALMAMQTAAASSPQVGHAYRIGPNGRLLDQLEAAAMLLALPKPVGCVVTVHDGMLEIHCRTTFTTEELEFERLRHDHQTSVNVKTLRDLVGGTEPNASVLVRATSQQLEVPFRAVAIWMRDYFLEMSYGFTIDRPTPEERARGARAVVTLSGSGGSFHVLRMPARSARN